ncbi:hypothetical protein [Paenibacillus sp. XY044]|uniref:hypothetical protein n=1 Tax=Paenibacillus sp. XY044 TaxID=2026089 RepID=UPI000B996C43|nr:hypothetical protein [Paenibacillus sp. XY044]OZB97824.1 hypothetical protein CJP46_01205 [Paenibacillus sp. XY044]
MKGNLLFNLVFGAVGFVLTLLISMGNNLFMTSLIRGLISFVIWFLLAFLLRWVWGVVSVPEAEHEAAAAEQERGTRFDMTTPDESDELNDLLTPRPASDQEDGKGFTPLNPPKLVSAKDPEELAKAVRHLSEK